MRGCAEIVRRSRDQPSRDANANDIVIDRNKLIVGKDEAPTTLTKDGM